ncbi:hypothetical protein ACJX0J_013888, partial [Zea mays]
ILDTETSNIVWFMDIRRFGLDGILINTNVTCFIWPIFSHIWQAYTHIIEDLLISTMFCNVFFTPRFFVILFKTALEYFMHAILFMITHHMLHNFSIIFLNQEFSVIDRKI